MLKKAHPKSNTEGLDRMRLSEALSEFPWPGDWSVEAFLDAIAARQEERSR